MRACSCVYAHLAVLRLHVLHTLTRALGEVLVGGHRSSGNGVGPVVQNRQVNGKKMSNKSTEGSMAMLVHGNNGTGPLSQELGLPFATALPAYRSMAAPSAIRSGTKTSARGVGRGRKAYFPGRAEHHGELSQSLQASARKEREDRTQRADNPEVWRASPVTSTPDLTFKSF